MFILLVLVLALAVALVRGGSFANFALVQIRWRGLIFLGFFIQVVIYSTYWQEQAVLKELTAAVYLGSLFLLLIALVANWRLPGLWLLTLGFALNVLVISANGGYMPSGYLARSVAGRRPLEPGEFFSNSVGMGPDTQLGFLGDIFALPHAPMFSNVFSIGDILIGLGAFLLIQGIMVNPAPQAGQTLDPPTA